MVNKDLNKINKIEIFGSISCSVFVKVSSVSLVSKHKDANLWHVDICIAWAAFLQWFRA